MNNHEIVVDIVELAAAACKAKESWGVFCSWNPYNYNCAHIWACLPRIVFSADNALPFDGWFLHYFKDKSSARSFYKECLGDDAGIHDGVFAVLINEGGEILTTNT